MIVIEMLPNQSGRAVEALQDNLILTSLQLESKNQPPAVLWLHLEVLTSHMVTLVALRWQNCVTILALT